MMKIQIIQKQISELCDFLEFIELREYGAGERYKDYGSREKISLRYYLSKTIAENTPYDDIPDIYIKFAEQLYDKDIVLSFNWDLLLEASLIVIVDTIHKYLTNNVPAAYVSPFR